MKPLLRRAAVSKTSRRNNSERGWVAETSRSTPCFHRAAAGALRTAALLLISVFSFQFSALGDLTATVSPGYTFVANERPDTSKLNRLGLPSITISGTIGGTNAGIGAGTLNGTMLVDTFAGSNLTWDASSPRQLVIKSSGVDTNQLAAGVAGAGLGGGGGTNLFVKYDPATLGANTNGALIAGTNLLWLYNARTNGVTNGNQFTLSSTNTLHLTTAIISAIPLPSATAAITNAHNLGVVPVFLRTVLVCGTANLGFLPGDEVDLTSLLSSSVSTGDFFGCPGTVSADGTNVVITVGGTSVLNWLVRRRTATIGTATAITPGSWTIKIYARP